MENQNDHQKNDEEILQEELNDREEDPIDESDASDYEWEREMQELWREFDEAYEVAQEEDPELSFEEEFGGPVSVGRQDRLIEPVNRSYLILL